MIDPRRNFPSTRLSSRCISTQKKKWSSLGKRRGIKIGERGEMKEKQAVKSREGRPGTESAEHRNSSGYRLTMIIFFFFFFQNICFQFQESSRHSTPRLFECPLISRVVTLERKKKKRKEERGQKREERRRMEGRREEAREKGEGNSGGEGRAAQWGEWKGRRRRKGMRKRKKNRRWRAMYPRIPFSVSFFSASAPARQRSFRNPQPGIHRTN